MTRKIPAAWGQMGTGDVNATSTAEGKVQVHGLTELGIGVKL